MEYKQIVSNRNYEISENGDVRRLVDSQYRAMYKAGRPKKTYLNHGGYEWVSLSDGPVNTQRAIHRLVYEAFVGPIPSGMTVNHKDRNKLNNHFSNLECLSHSDNVKDSWSVPNRASCLPRGEANFKAKLTVDAVRKMRQMYENGATTVSIGTAFNVAQQTAYCVVKRRTWKHVTD